MRTTLLLGDNDIREVGSIEAVNGAFASQISSRVLTVGDLASIAGALSVAGESQFSGKARFQQEVILGKRLLRAQKDAKLVPWLRIQPGLPYLVSQAYGSVPQLQSTTT